METASGKEEQQEGEERAQESALWTKGQVSVKVAYRPMEKRRVKVTEVAWQKETWCLSGVGVLLNEAFGVCAGERGRNLGASRGCSDFRFFWDWQPRATLYRKVPPFLMGEGI